ncbi:hypothetical protein NLX83_24915 [Allokutzneria sp. A3M-2-11 16]|uniref:hypothetical protein n=1 Tax=Allokutzneria sp. A3M-2-11 16 TaxID=2962043 RepID=UPI0020B76B97|nr:hypothetical protein [Allokutzneria sp. A3M-2-11 16]MCP3802517.1 hypothetical protein [Allokutzneria sp. A3M-2-11 16]
MADRRRKRSAIAVALTLGVSVVVPLAVTTLGAVGAALFVAAKYTTADLAPERAAAVDAVDSAETQADRGPAND